MGVKAEEEQQMVMVGKVLSWLEPSRLFTCVIQVGDLHAYLFSVQCVPTPDIALSSN
jgi:hypothetical protein